MNSAKLKTEIRQTMQQFIKI